MIYSIQNGKGIEESVDGKDSLISPKMAAARLKDASVPPPPQASVSAGTWIIGIIIDKEHLRQVVDN